MSKEPKKGTVLPAPRTQKNVGSKVQADAVAWAEKQGWYCIRIMRTEIRGRPDHCFIRDGKVVWVEFKGTTETLKSWQEKALGDMIAAGAIAWVCRDLATFKRRMM